MSAAVPEVARSRPSVLARDYTAGRRGPITVSRFWSWDPWWGRQDMAVYIVGAVVLVASLLCVPMVFPLVNERLPEGPFYRVFAAVVVAVGVAALTLGAGAAASLMGLKTRDLPRHLLIVASAVPGYQRLARSHTPEPGPEPYFSLEGARSWLVALEQVLPPELLNPIMEGPR